MRRAYLGPLHRSSPHPNLVVTPLPSLWVGGWGAGGGVDTYVRVPHTRFCPLLQAGAWVRPSCMPQLWLDPLSYKVGESLQNLIPVHMDFLVDPTIPEPSYPTGDAQA